MYMLGFKINPYKYLSNSDVFVLTSNYEGMPNVVLEAMSTDLPVIATDCEGGTREILEDKYGILIKNLSKEYDITEKIHEEEIELANKMIELIENESKREQLKKLSQERIKDFETEKIKQKWIDIIYNC